MIAIDLVLDRLTALGCNPRRSGSGWAANAPGRQDDHPSLTIAIGDNGKVLLHDHGGSSFSEILQALDLEPADLRPETRNGQLKNHSSLRSSLQRGGNETRADATRVASQPKTPSKPRSVIASHDYVDATGALLMQVCRTDDGGRFVRRPGVGNGWIYDANAVPRVLYRLPELLKVPISTMTFVVEGERDVDALHGAGLSATTCPFGAGSWRHLDDDSALEDRRICVVPDNDDLGRAHAEDVAGRLHGRAASIKVLKLPDLPEKGDVRDWLAAGNDPEDLDRLAAEAPEWEPAPPAADLTELETGRKLTRPEARRKLDHIFRLRGTIQDAGIEMCRELAGFFDRGGREALADDDGAPMSHAYIAGGLGVTRQRLDQYIGAGRAWKNTCNQGCINSDGQESTFGELLTERHLRPLVKLEPDQQCEALTDALKVAREQHQIEQKHREKEGRRPTRFRLTASHVSKAVKRLLPDAKPKPAQVDATTRPEELWKTIAESLDEALALPGVPAEVLTLRGQLHAAFRGWVAGGDG